MKFAPIFGDGMVLQRDRELTVWGTSQREETVCVSLGDLRAESSVINGSWKCTFPPQKAAWNQTLLARQGEEVICIQNVMIGDVWLAGGQSNMEFYLRYEHHWEEAQALPPNPAIRMYTCPRIAYAGQEPFQPGCGYWFGEGDSAWETFAASAYWFARELQPELGAPVGIISCNWGGTSASAWVPAQCLAGNPLDRYLEDYEAAIAGTDPEEIRETSLRGWAFQRDPDHLREWAGAMYGIDRQAQLERIRRCADNPVVPMGPYNKNRPGCLYEYMVKPIRDYAVRGVIWYQGENDVHHAPLYSTLFTKLIEEWRKLWGADLPFLFAQLAPFDCWLALNGAAFPEIRRQQERVSKSVKNCWMIATSDVGMRYDIHPKEKKALGRRFCLQALDKVYGHPCLADAPEIREAKLRGNMVQVWFSNAGTGLHTEGNVLPLFSASQNGTPLELRAVQVSGDMLTLAVAQKTDAPVDLTFAACPYYKVTLYNSAGIPANPFSVTVEVPI